MLDATAEPENMAASWNVIDILILLPMAVNIHGAGSCAEWRATGQGDRNGAGRACATGEAAEMRLVGPAPSFSSRRGKRAERGGRGANPAYDTSQG